MSTVSTVQYLDLCVAFHCVAVDTTPLYILLFINKPYTEKLLVCVFPVRVLRRVLSSSIAVVKPGGHHVPPLQ